MWLGYHLECVLVAGVIGRVQHHPLGLLLRLAPSHAHVRTGREDDEQQDDREDG